MKNDTKQSEEKVFTANDMSLILERVDDSVKLLAENHASLVSGQNEIMDALKGVENRLGSVENRLGNVENRLGNVENRLELVETKIDRLQDDMVEVKFEVRRKVDAEEFEKLEKRVVKLENLSLSHQA